MTSSVAYLAYLFIFIVIVYLVVKRPISETMLWSFIFILTITGTWNKVFVFVEGAFSNSLIYTILAFTLLSFLLTELKLIDTLIDFLLRKLGRVPGGVGYVAVLIASFMGATSGSGPGNVMATGIVTIPAMKKSGFPDYVAANISSSSSTMGNMIPPSGVIVASFNSYLLLYGDGKYSIGDFWLILWGISIYFIMHRLLMVFYYVRKYKIQGLTAKDASALVKNSKDLLVALLLPVIILIPFMFNSICEGFIVERLGNAGAKSFSSSILIFVPGLTALYALAVSKRKTGITFAKICDIFGRNINKTVDSCATVLFAYMVGEVFDYLGLGDSVLSIIAGLGLSRLAIAFLLPLFTMFLGMMFPGSAQIAMLGTTFIGVMYSVGINPILAAAMLPCICGAMSGITPPVAVCLYAAIAVAESDPEKSMMASIPWVLGHYILSVLVLAGLIPILGV